eukprot:588139-Hanusia_phi.AAC.1
MQFSLFFAAIVMCWHWGGGFLMGDHISASSKVLTLEGRVAPAVLSMMRGGGRMTRIGRMIYQKKMKLKKQRRAQRKQFRQDVSTLDT